MKEKEEVIFEIYRFYDKLAIGWHQGALEYMGARPEEFSHKMIFDYEANEAGRIGDIAADIRRLDGEDVYEADMLMIGMVVEAAFRGLEQKKMGLNFSQICSVNCVLADAARKSGEPCLRGKWSLAFAARMEFQESHFMCEPPEEEKKVCMMLPDLLAAGFIGLGKVLKKSGLEKSLARVWN